MTAPLNVHEVIVRDLLAQIHPSLHAQLQAINFEHLTPKEVRSIFGDNCETVLRDLVREMREKRLLP